MTERDIDKRQTPIGEKKPSSPDSLVESDKSKVELSEDDLKNVSGGHFPKAT